jgi:hypothetical protein
MCLNYLQVYYKHLLKFECPYGFRYSAMWRMPIWLPAEYFEQKRG